MPTSTTMYTFYIIMKILNCYFTFDLQVSISVVSYNCIENTVFIVIKSLFIHSKMYQPVGYLYIALNIILYTHTMPLYTKSEYKNYYQKYCSVQILKD